MSSQDHDQSTAPRRGPFVLWLILTILLALATAAAWWALQNRAATIVEVEGETPPPIPLTEAQTTEIARLQEVEALRESQLRQSVDAIDPPVCEAPKALDVGKFTTLRRREDGSFSAWRTLLNAPSPTVSGPQSTAPQLPDPDPSAPANPGPTPPIPPTNNNINTAHLPLPVLSERLEETTAIVIGFGRGDEAGLSTGTGFFIGPSLLVTNDHVVVGMDPQKIFVTNRRLGGIRTARLITRSGQKNAGDIDFALLEIEGEPVARWLNLASGQSKLTPVIAAGYPGLSLGSDEGFRRLLRGDLTAAPDLNMNRGEVRSVRPFSAITQIIHTADVLKGYSGGPLIDLCGRVIGVNTFISVDRTQAAKLNNAISANNLAPFLTDARAPFALSDETCSAPQ